jgi:hypothetical protein
MAGALSFAAPRSSPKGGEWNDDYDVFDGEHCVGRVYQVNDCPGRESWFWGVSFGLIRRKCYGYAATLDEAKAAFRTEYEAWKGGAG